MNDSTAAAARRGPGRPRKSHAPIPSSPPADDAHVAPGASLFSDPTQRAPVAGVAADDPRARAARRAAELREHGSLEDGSDKFAIDPKMVPDGWSYEYRTYTVLGKEDPSYQVTLANAGWEAVPAARHRELMPAGYQGGTILRDGMMLMERPLEITEEAKRRDQKNARDQVRAKEAQLTGAAPPGEFDRSNKGDRLTSIKKTREATIPIPDK